MATHAMWAAGGVVLIALLAAVELGRMPSTTAVVAVGMSAQVWPGSSTGLFFVSRTTHDSGWSFLRLTASTLPLYVPYAAAGRVSIRLPFPPGVEYDYMQDPPKGSLPPKFNSSFVVDNNLLQQAEYILADKVTGVETVAVGMDGSLGLVDRLGKVSQLLCLYY